MAATMMPISSPIAIFFFNMAISSPNPNPTMSAKAGDLLILGFVDCKVGIGDQVGKESEGTGDTRG